MEPLEKLWQSVEGVVTYFICKACGRSMKADAKPNYCYADRMDYYENISDEDALKMGLDIPDGEIFEFPGDIKWNPISGKPCQGAGRTLHDFQRETMVRVLQ